MALIPRIIVRLIEELAYSFEYFLKAFHNMVCPCTCKQQTRRVVHAMNYNLCQIEKCPIKTKLWDGSQWHCKARFPKCRLQQRKQRSIQLSQNKQDATHGAVSIGTQPLKILRDHAIAKCHSFNFVTLRLQIELFGPASTENKDTLSLGEFVSPVAGQKRTNEGRRQTESTHNQCWPLLGKTSETR